MRAAWRVADVRAAERALMATLPAGTLMQRAAGGLAGHCARLLAERGGGVYGARVLLLVGSGDNGGDTLYAGARLAGRGAAVSALLLAPERVHQGGLAALRAAGGRIVDGLPDRADLVLDGIVGIGGSGGLREPAARLVAGLPGLTGRSGDRPPVVAVDVPSGVEVDTGDVPRSVGLPSTVTADLTVTFGCLKSALVVGPAAPRAGRVELVDIGLGPSLRGTPAVRVTEWSDVSDWWPRLGPEEEKYSRGVVGLATGSATYPGAAVLSVGGAVAGPTGMIRYAGGARAEVLRRYPSVVAADRVTEAGRVQAWVCGSGLGTDDAAATELRCVLAAPVPVVLDADALTLLVDGSMAERLRERDAPIVVTPHDREYARLCGEPPRDRVAAALQLASWMNAVVLLKGDRTVVATPDGQAFANPTGTPALATAGTGDVLAGLLGSLLAAGVPAERAAAAAAYLHGLAGQEAARRGPVVAADVAAALRRVIARLPR
ncbi:NAD(P)H-hydrate dehydratase [Plantactinospora sp. BC1]|uniref:NAD(P)H-hydrate dehydratase n=1 Tax=Plantactinospora sp. BC1 TaxID=2108470 RepID=UPI000D16AC8D|nr:NAD(P)H-hydrate dehydratase [Plantactinospora sp. BC1]AVT33453.1 NAD(P)H-hydrate dehydratase [Plantactinospora sp. BC1]